MSREKIKNLIPSKIKFYIKNIKRLFDVFLMMIALNFKPSEIFRFSTRKFIPPKKFRFKKKDLKLVPYKFINEKSGNIDQLDEVYAIGIGSSFEISKIKNMIDKPIFLLAFWDSLKIDQQGQISYYTDDSNLYGHKANYFSGNKYIEYINPKITYVTSHLHVANKLLKKGHKVLIVTGYTAGKNSSLVAPGKSNYESDDFRKLLENPNIKRVSILDEIIKFPTEQPFPNWTQTGSIIPYLAAISFFSKKIDVFGWDFFLNKSPNEMSYLELIQKMYSNDADWKRSLSHFEEAIFNFYFGFSFSKNKKFKIHSFMGHLNNHQKLIEKIEKSFLIVCDKKNL